MNKLIKIFCYKTNTLPPKVVTTRLQPIFPPGTAQTSIPQF